MVESILKKNITELVKTSNKLGSQALILSLPFKLINGKPYQFDYISKKTLPFNSNIIHLFKEKIVSELLLSDVFNEGQVSSFNLKILKHFKNLKYR